MPEKAHFRFLRCTAKMATSVNIATATAKIATAGNDITELLSEEAIDGKGELEKDDGEGEGVKDCDGEE